MSTQEIKERLKNNIDNLSPNDARLASKDLDDYFSYLQERRQMPKNLKISFAQYQKLLLSLQQADQSQLYTASKVFNQQKACLAPTNE